MFKFYKWIQTQFWYIMVKDLKTELQSWIIFITYSGYIAALLYIEFNCLFIYLRIYNILTSSVVLKFKYLIQHD